MMAKNYITAYQTELANERASRQEIVPTTTVLVATRQLKYGEPLLQEDVREVLWPVSAIPEGTFQAITDLFPETDVNGRNRVVLRAMEPDEAIMAVKVTQPGQDAGIMSQLERGMRAIAIKVDVTSGVSGFLRPGDRVDVYWTGSIQGVAEGTRGEVTRMIQPSIELVAVDQTASTEITGATIARSVTVVGTPAQVAALKLAESTGRLTLALVGAGDDTIAAAIEVDQRALLGLGAIEQEQSAPSKKVCTIRTRRGAEVMEIPIPCTN